jgi:hypothetical protein
MFGSGLASWQKTPISRGLFYDVVNNFDTFSYTLIRYLPGGLGYDDRVSGGIGALA